MENNYLCKEDNTGMKFSMKDSNKKEKTNKCSQCEFASYWAVSLRTHLKIHSGEKSNKCNQCDYASSCADTLRTHFKTHSGEKSNKCNQCNYL